MTKTNKNNKYITKGINITLKLKWTVKIKIINNNNCQPFFTVWLFFFLSWEKKTIKTSPGPSHKLSTKTVNIWKRAFMCILDSALTHQATPGVAHEQHTVVHRLWRSELWVHLSGALWSEHSSEELQDEKQWLKIQFYIPTNDFTSCLTTPVSSGKITTGIHLPGALLLFHDTFLSSSSEKLLSSPRWKPSSAAKLSIRRLTARPFDWTTEAAQTLNRLKEMEENTFLHSPCSAKNVLTSSD